jgi:hypothetical protein
MHIGQSAIALADRGANRIDDHGFTHLCYSDLGTAHRPVNEDSRLSANAA